MPVRDIVEKLKAVKRALWYVVLGALGIALLAGGVYRLTAYFEAAYVPAGAVKALVAKYEKDLAGKDRVINDLATSIAESDKAVAELKAKMAKSKEEAAHVQAPKDRSDLVDRFDALGYPCR